MMSFEEFVEYKKKEARLDALVEEYSKDHNDFYIVIELSPDQMIEALENALNNGTTYEEEVEKIDTIPGVLY